MPFDPSAEAFADLTEQALDAKEIRDKLNESESSTDELRAFIAQRAPEIWASASVQIASYNEAEKAVAAAEADFSVSVSSAPFLVYLFSDLLPGVFGIAIGLAVLIGLASWGLAFVRQGVVWLFLRISWIPTVAIAAIIVLSLVILYWTSRPGRQKYAALKSASHAALEAARRQRDAHQNDIFPAVINSIVANLREFFDNMASPPFRLDLPDADTTRFSEVPNPQFDIITDARRYLRTRVEKMNGGSIGIAGPRGCGKTTLLRSFCPEGNVDPKELSIFATAPVQYEPREFLLQIFTFVCSRIIAKETKTDQQSSWTEMDSLRASTTPTLLEPGIAASILTVVAFILLSFGFMLASVRIYQASAHFPKSPTVTTQTAASSISALIAASNAKIEWTVHAILDSDALPYLLWGAIAFLCATVLLFYADGAGVPEIVRFYSPYGIVERLRGRKKAKAAALAPEEIRPKAVALVNRARRTLRGLRFQQSYSSGWSGSLKLPVGLEGGANTAITFAERQLGLPEIVYEYREFLKAAAACYDRIFVGIDELDKLPSDEDAKKFLNGIKAIFGQEKTYYIVSISENALSNFERRGLPIRDEFDSSFDDAVHLNYFDLVSSRRLLARRSSEPPPAVYRAFCHVVSGGLPRDLIRICRNLYDYRREFPTSANTIADLSGALICRDIKAKLDAVQYSLQRVTNEKAAAGLLSLISVRSWDANSLQDVLYSLHRSQQTLEESASRSSNPDQRADSLELASIVEETKAYLYFCLATIVIFHSITGQAVFQQLEQASTFDRLATARQLLAVNRTAAMAALHAIVPLPLTPLTALPPLTLIAPVA
jgi:hypothetical protein